MDVNKNSELILVPLFSKEVLIKSSRYIILIIIVTVIIGSLFYHNTINNERTMMLQTQEVTLDLMEGKINKEMNKTFEQLVLSSKDDSHLTYLINEDYSLNANESEEIKEHFVLLEEILEVYDQMRILDSSGMEVIRVDYNNGDIAVVDESNLQDKSNRYYFYEVFAGDPGDIYISPLDLNVERGEIEIPFKPMIRIGMPFADVNDNKCGIILFNYNATTLLLDVKDLLSKFSEEEIMLINSDGYYLLHEDSSMEWGFMFPDKKEINLKNDYPKLWDSINANGEGYLEEEDRYFSYRKIKPLENGKQDYYWTAIVKERERPIAYSRITNTIMVMFLIAIILSIIVMTVIKNKEDEQRRRLYAEYMTQKANNANEAKSRFLSNMSHELRTPLNAVVGFSNLLLRTEVDDTQFDYLKKIKLSSNILLGLINDILSLAKIETNQMQLDIRCFQFIEMIETIQAQVSGLIKEKDLEFKCEIDEKIPIYVFGDSLKLTQIFINLINNAVKFTPEGSIVLKAELKENKNDASVIQFTVTDTGIGLTEDQMTQIFKPFIQAEASTTRKYGGTGLGLSITKEFISLMGGELYVESKKDVGTSFKFHIPFSYRYDEYRNMVEGLDVRAALIDFKQDKSVLYDYLTFMSVKTDIVKSDSEILLKVKNNEFSEYEFIVLNWNSLSQRREEMISKIINSSGETDIIVIADYKGKDVFPEDYKGNVKELLFNPIQQSTLFNTILYNYGKDEVEHFLMHVDSNEEEEKLKDKDILLVEDNELNIEIAVGILEPEGPNITIAVDGMSAVEFANSEEFDLILMDIQLPGIDGFEATRRIRQHEMNKNTSIIAMTANSMKKDVEECIKAGMNDHISKPFEPSKLISLIQKYVKR